MKEFEVEITETLQRTVVIRAGSRAEAEVLAEEMPLIPTKTTGQRSTPN